MCLTALLLDWTKKLILQRKKTQKSKKKLTDLRENVQYHSDNVYEINKKLDDIYK